MRVVWEPSNPATTRCQEVAAMFSLDIHQSRTVELACPLPWEKDPQRDWTIGLIVGPSGSGKTTFLKAGFGPPLDLGKGIPTHLPVVDCFPRTMSAADISLWLSSVGFSNPSAWIKPVRELSAGQAWRASLAVAAARSQAEGSPLILDEFGTLVDEVQGRVGSFALGKLLRRKRIRMVASTWREDLVDWLQPDWIMKPHLGHLEWRCLWRKPAIPVVFQRTDQSLWRNFAEHHYLSGKLHRSSLCFGLFHREWGPIAFSAWLPFFGASIPSRREHRTVCLPPYQGVGAGKKLSALCASLFRGLGYRALSTTSHPGVIQSRLADPNWKLLRRLSHCSRGQDKSPRVQHAIDRLTAGFEYLGPAMPVEVARSVLGALRMRKRSKGVLTGAPGRCIY